jgi:SAM-dependent methyltransferase
VPAAERWAEALGRWAIPEDILAAAPESPWSLPPSLFRAGGRAPAGGSPSTRRAREAIPGGGTILDVGCGGGGAGLALVPPAGRVVGVDSSPAMLAAFAAEAARRGVDHAEVEGVWPDVAPGAGDADVVVCHHVVYNVAGIAAFVAALAGHARRRVVVELTDRHPTAPMTPLWRRFWGLDRPEGPTAELFVEVVAEAGFAPLAERHSRPALRAGAGPGDAEYVAFVRRRLCLDASRDPEVAAALAAAADGAEDVTTVTVWWDPAGGG